MAAFGTDKTHQLKELGISEYLRAELFSSLMNVATADNVLVSYPLPLLPCFLSPDRVRQSAQIREHPRN